ncbi:hypothetical protein [Lentzea sp. NBRC 102530]|uniref:LGFP repeat-containing protein n=1 Tax=Lentzea sp. NBRC 102530 TaxID=3032201 RepID=UPI0024A143A7|nr:hypothetical protein [Lentzea sp. NBRC 102530]GLY48073.1 hypothetical protein Lesp01_17290 [Lentzea sp. NBRC 102530]
MFVRRCAAVVVAFVAATAVAGTAQAAPDWNSSPVKAKWEALGGASFAGEKVGDEVVLENGIRWARFSRYDIVITWRESAGAHWMSGAISRLWLGTSPATSAATMDQVPVNRGAQAGAAIAYDTGYSVYYSDAYGAHAVGGPTRDKYWANGSVTGRFGWPTSGRLDIGDGTGTEQRFSEAVSFFDQAGEMPPFWISGALRDKYRSLGGPEPTSRVDWLTSDQVEQPGGGWSVQIHGNEGIYWSPATGAALVHSGPNEVYLAKGGPAGPFGYPKGDTRRRSGEPGEQSNVTEFVQNYGLYQADHVRGTYWMGGGLRDTYEAIETSSGQRLGDPRTNPAPGAGHGRPVRPVRRGPGRRAAVGSAHRWSRPARTGARRTARGR